MCSVVLNPGYPSVTKYPLTLTLPLTEIGVFFWANNLKFSRAICESFPVNVSAIMKSKLDRLDTKRR